MAYTVYHLHSDDSLLDSCTKYSEYVDLAVAQGMKAIASTEHGKPSGWVSKKLYCQQKGIKFIHGVEIYLTETLEEKIRDNYHTVLLAKNYDGVLELNKLIELATRPDHTHYNPRITFDEFLAISPNIIKISACIASPLRRLPHSHEKYLRLAKAYDYFEIQHHNIPEQIEYNRYLFELAERLGKPLIAGTDTHSASPYKAECRSVLMDYKDQYYEGEEDMDLTWKTYDELVAAYEKQNAIPRWAYMEAIENTNRMADSVEDFVLDQSPKYPISCGSREADEEKLHEITWRMLDEKLAAGVIPREQEETFRKDIEEEFEAFHKTNMSGFMLSMSEIISWCRNNDIPIGPNRGSVGGSRVAYVTDIIDMNPVTYHTSGAGNYDGVSNVDRTAIVRVSNLALHETCDDSSRVLLYIPNGATIHVSSTGCAAIGYWLHAVYKNTIGFVRHKNIEIASSNNSSVVKACMRYGAPLLKKGQTSDYVILDS